MAAPDLYDELGRSYSATRGEDPVFALAIRDVLGDGRSVLNVGAGTGSYEPTDRHVVAVEPSMAMISQRSGRSRQVVRGVAGALPFADGTFDVALAVLTVHHWPDQVAGLRELRRVARRQVVLYFEPMRNHDFWALEYFPASVDLPSERNPPGEALLREVLGVREVRTVLVPPDCRDGFGAAYWCRPEAYLDPLVQAGMSWLGLLGAEARAEGSAVLAADLASGEWERRHGHLRRLDAFDGGYRIAIADG